MIRPITRALFAIVVTAAFLAAAPLWCRAAEGDGPSVVSIRTGSHPGKKLDRLVVELDAETDYSVKIDGPKGFISIPGAGAATQKVENGFVGEPIFTVSSIESRDEAVVIEVDLSGEAAVKDYVYTDPFRIIVDFTRDKTKAKAADKARPEIKKSSARKSPIPAKAETKTKTTNVDATTVSPEPDKTPDVKVSAGPAESVKKEGKSREEKTKIPGSDLGVRVVVRGGDSGDHATDDSIAARDGSGKSAQEFNSGWRWLYRQKIVEEYRDGVINGDGLDLAVVATGLGLLSTERSVVKEKIAELAAAAMKAGRMGEADTLEAFSTLIDFSGNVDDAERAANLLRTAGEGPLKRTGSFLLGSFYEKIGFIPEADAYYSLAVEDDEPGLEGSFASMAAVFRLGRLYFLEGRFTRAKRLLTEAVDFGVPGAGLWLANTLLVKGEYGRAWELYGEYGGDHADPITLMSLADLSLVHGDSVRARMILGLLWSRENEDGLLKSYMRMRIADTYFYDGNYDEAVKTYEEISAESEGDIWAIGALATADALVNAPPPEEEEDEGKRRLEEAAELYGSVAKGDFTGTSAAYIALAELLSDLGRHEEAVEELKRFIARFPTNELRRRVDALKSIIAYRWLTVMFEESDWYGMAKLNTTHPYAIPFGKKGETYLMLGRAFSELGLYPDAANKLQGAVKFGDGETVESAMVMLFRVYIEQGDPQAVEKLFESFTSRFRESPRMKEALASLLAAKMLSGDYEAAAKDFDSLYEPASLILRGRANLKIKRPAVALKLFKRAAAALGDSGEAALRARAAIGAADSEFAMGGLEKAASHYGSALAIMEKAAPAEVEAADQPRFDGKLGVEHSWALFRMTQIHSMLGDKKAMNSALDTLSEEEVELSEWADTLF